MLHYTIFLYFYSEMRNYLTNRSVESVFCCKNTAQRSVLILDFNAIIVKLQHIVLFIDYQLTMLYIYIFTFTEYINNLLSH